MPLRRSALPAGDGMRIHGRLDWGGLARLHLLDGRQHRSHQACPKPYRGGGNYLPDCAARFDPALSFLGLEQERWLDEGLGEARTAWNLVVQTTLVATAPRPGGKGPVYWTDGWDGYPAARERLLRSIAERKAANPVLLGGDVHAAVHANLHARPGDPDSPVVAAELVATSITSQGPAARASEALKGANPHIRHADGTVRGYHMIELTRSGLDARVRGVATVKQPDAAISTVATARVEAGRPGLA